MSELLLLRGSNSAFVLISSFGLIGALSLIRIVTKSSTFIACICLLYLIWLLPENITNGAFAGTVLFSMLIVLACKRFNLNVSQSIIFVFIGYIIHYINEESMQSRVHVSIY